MALSVFILATFLKLVHLKRQLEYPPATKARNMYSGIHLPVAAACYISRTMPKWA
jgi:hypothetical protein